ncbi:zymogen granule membrane protein 16-like [Nelusetta ayraudi]|uniref:zymogen granule membrane protein 16-like n=1 Tax=Nelusetta ayraudi TaxID=303726 RepID=UPI003F7225F0
MYLFLIITFLTASSLAYPAQEHYSFSPSVGRGDGSAFVIEGEGRITGIRIWEHNGAYIAGIQLRYGYIWSKVVGNTHGPSMVEMELFDNERLTQISGKYHPHNYIYELYMVTTRGRFLHSGQPTQITFNMYAAHMDAELIMLSGRYNHWGITALAAHWGVVDIHQGNSTYNNGAAQ